MKRAVCLLNINKNGILVVSRKEEISKFGMPGGKVEDNETILEAIIRETFEETGVILDSNNLIPIFEEYADKNKIYWTTVFLSFKENINPIQKEEGINPFFVDETTFLGENAFFKEFNNMTFEKLKKINFEEQY